MSQVLQPRFGLCGQSVRPSRCRRELRYDRIDSEVLVSVEHVLQD